MHLVPARQVRHLLKKMQNKSRCPLREENVCLGKKKSSRSPVLEFFRKEIITIHSRLSFKSLHTQKQHDSNPVPSLAAADNLPADHKQTKPGSQGRKSGSTTSSITVGLLRKLIRVEPAPKATGKTTVLWPDTSVWKSWQHFFLPAEFQITGD